MAQYLYLCHEKCQVLLVVISLPSILKTSARLMTYSAQTMYWATRIFLPYNKKIIFASGEKGNIFFLCVFQTIWSGNLFHKFLLIFLIWIRNPGLKGLKVNFTTFDHELNWDHGLGIQVYA